MPRLATFGGEARYVLEPGDVLEIQYRYTPEFNQTLTVQPDGSSASIVRCKGGGRTRRVQLLLAKAKHVAAPELNIVLEVQSLTAW